MFRHLFAVRYWLYRLPLALTKIMDALLCMGIWSIIQLEPMTKNILFLQPKLLILLMLLRLLWLHVMLVKFMRTGQLC